MRRFAAACWPAVAVIALAAATSAAIRGHVHLWGEDVAERLLLLAASAAFLAFDPGGSSRTLRVAGSQFFAMIVVLLLVPPFAALYMPGALGFAYGTALVLVLGFGGRWASGAASGRKMKFSLVALATAWILFDAGNLLLAANMAGLGGLAFASRASRPGPLFGYYLSLLLFAQLYGGVHAGAAILLAVLAGLTWGDFLWPQVLTKIWAKRAFGRASRSA